MAKKRSQSSDDNIEQTQEKTEQGIDKSNGAEQDGEEIEVQYAQSSDVQELRKKLEETENKAKESYDTLIRLQADFENYKKRIAKERIERLEYGYEEVIKSLLPVIDDLDTASKHVKNSTDSDALVQGVNMILKKVNSILGKYGVKEIKSVGEKFDPALHEAMAHVESVDHEPNTVIEEFRKGYLLKKKLLRPSMVTVSKVALEKTMDDTQNNREDEVLSSLDKEGQESSAKGEDMSNSNDEDGGEKENNIQVNQNE